MSKGEGGSGGGVRAESDTNLFLWTFCWYSMSHAVSKSWRSLQAIRIMFTPLNIGAYDLENCFSIFSSVASFIHQIHTFSLDPPSDQYYKEK